MSPVPFITIITATKNTAARLPELAASIRRQTFHDFEWVVVDGASTDGTPDILRQNEDLIAWWGSEPDTGIYDAWNKGLKRTRGTWICFLGADDRLGTDDALERMAVALAGVPADIRVVYGRVAILGRNGETLYHAGQEWPRVRRRFRSLMAVPHTGLMHHRTVFAEHGEFDPSYRIAGDYEFLLRELKNGEAAFVPGLIFAAMNQGGVSSKPESMGINLQEYRRAARRHGQRLPGLPWMLAMVRHSVRRILWSVLGEVAARHWLDRCRLLSDNSPYWTKI